MSSVTMASSAVAEWQDMPDIPTPEELLAPHDSALPEVVEDEAMDKDAYLEAQYMLHRHEATAALRGAIQEISQHGAVIESADANVYTQVCVLGYRPTKSGLAWRVSWAMPPSPPESPELNSQTDILTPGTLVALTPKTDFFRTKCLVAVIAHDDLPDYMERKDISSCDLLWSRPEDAILDPSAEMIMLEPKTGYFEPCRRTMTSLQLAASFTSRYDKYLYKDAGACKEHVPASFLRLAPNEAPVTSDQAEQLDSSQLEALTQAVSQELAIVQGPPGTGKTFTSVVTLDSHIRTMKACHQTLRSTPPIIVAAQTNHAVDQILRRCLDAGLGPVVRIGRGTQDEEVSQWSLFNLRSGSKVPRPEKKVEPQYRRAVKEILDHMGHCLASEGLYEAETLYEAKLISLKQFRSLHDDDDWETEEGEDNRSAMAKWLNEFGIGSEAVGAEAKTTAGTDQEDIYQQYTTLGQSMPDQIWRSVEPDERNVWTHKAIRLLNRHTDLYQIPLAQRATVYCFLHKQMQARAIPALRQAMKTFSDRCDGYKRSRCINNAAIIQGEGICLLGCTTTGLVKHRDLLTALQPQILLVEEAAETREGNIAAALLPSVKQLVLVGDHQQLVPHVDIWELGKCPHRLNISVFERLVKIGVPFCSLRVQRRMAPALREVVQGFYPYLEDHSSVSQRPAVPGMGSRRLWWFDHQWTQNRTELSSFENAKEADMIVGFVDYLTQNGVLPSKITVLAYYNGQVSLIQHKLKAHPTLGALPFERSVRTIDGFQGEENDVILLSLVRGPGSDGSQARVGFVADENRAVVATSRARCGLFIFGNKENVLSTPRSRQTWLRVCESFRGRIREFLPVVCSAHEKDIKVTCAEDWQRVLMKGCGERCQGDCAHGRRCVSTCHGAKRPHGCNCAPTGPSQSQPSTPTLPATDVASSGPPQTPKLRSVPPPTPRLRPGPPQTPTLRAAKVSPARQSKSSSTRSEDTTNPSYQTPNTSVQSSPRRVQERYETSDDIMDKGYRTFMSGEESDTETMSEDRWARGTDGEELLISFSPDLVASPKAEEVLPTAESGRDLWRAEAVVANDRKRERQIEREAKAAKDKGKERQGDGPMIVETFIKTRLDANGARQYDSLL